MSRVWKLGNFGSAEPKLWVGHDYAKGSCCDLDLQGSDPNVARDALSHYGIISVK